MQIIDNVNLINQIFTNDILFEECDQIKDFNIVKCEDYDDMNLYICKKKLDDKINNENFIKQLSKIEIRNSLFNSYLEINKVKDINENSWIEKSVYNDKNYNIQKFILNNNSMLCFSDTDLDDDNYDYIWINNPFTKISVDENNQLILMISFESNNQYQQEILNNFLSCLNKLELALVT